MSIVYSIASYYFQKLTFLFQKNCEFLLGFLVLIVSCSSSKKFNRGSFNNKNVKISVSSLIASIYRSNLVRVVHTDGTNIVLENKTGTKNNCWEQDRAVNDEQNITILVLIHIHVIIERRSNMRNHI